MLIILNYMATSSANTIYTNTYIPEYASDNLKWYKRDGLDTWYKKNKCDKFLEDTDRYFHTTQIINFILYEIKKQLQKINLSNIKL